MTKPSSPKKQSELNIPNYIRFIWSGIALILIIVRLLWSDIKIDEITLGLLIIGSLPWFLSIIETTKLPGGIEIKMRVLERAVQNQEQEVQEQKLKLYRQQEIIHKLVAYSMSGFIFGQLQRIFYAQKNKELYTFDGSIIVKRELQFLFDHGYIEYVNLQELQQGENLTEKVKITPAGELYVQLREELEGIQE